MLWVVVGILIGFLLLLKGSSMVVRHGLNVAAGWNLPPLLMGMTFVAFGASLPEAAIAITSIIHGIPELAASVVIGSNIVNLSLVLGLAAFLHTLAIDEKPRKELYFLFVSAALLFLLPYDTLLGGSTFSLQWYDGVILLITLMVFLHHILKSVKFTKEKNTTSDFLLFLVGIAGVVIGSWILVQATAKLQIPLLSMGLLVLALGVSLPEIFTVIHARKQNSKELSIGVIIGSCVFNMLWVLGIASFFGTIPFSLQLFFQLLLMVLFSFFLYFFLFLQRRLTSFEGFILMGAYIVYVVSLL